MDVQLNHTIVWCRDKEKSSAFLVELFDLPPPIPFGPFLAVRLSNQTSLDFYSQDGEIASQHYAFRVSEKDFDTIFARIRAKGLPYWGTPGKQNAGEIYHYNGGRGVYFDDPDGHFLEVLTRPTADSF